VPFGGKKQSGIGLSFLSGLGTRNIGFYARLFNRARARKLRIRRVYLRESCAVEFRREAGLAALIALGVIKGHTNLKSA
jgi:hypothetical protein